MKMEKRKEKNRDCLMTIYICLCAATVLHYTREYMFYTTVILSSERETNASDFILFLL